MPASNQPREMTAKLCVALTSAHSPANVLWPSLCVLCHHLLMLVDFFQVMIVLWWTYTYYSFCRQTHSSGLHGRNLTNHNSPFVFSKTDTEHFGIRAIIITTTTCPVHRLCVWLINDVTGGDWAKAWARHFNCVKTMAPKHHSHSTKHVLWLKNQNETYHSLIFFMSPIQTSLPLP